MHWRTIEGLFTLESGEEALHLGIGQDVAFQIQAPKLGVLGSPMLSVFV